MAGRGPAPKDPALRRRRNKSEPLEVIAADGNAHGPDLPDTFEWPVATLEWWRVWRSSAVASKLTATDWSFLLDTAVLHAEFWLGNRGLAPELRLRVAKFGATLEDRARLKLEVGDPDRPAVPTRLQTKTARSRRARLLRAVGDDGADEV